MNRAFGIILTLLFIIFITGCEARRMIYSEPLANEGGIERSKDGMFALTNINLMVVPHNSDIAYGLFWYVVPLFPTPGRTSDHDSKSFWITLIFDPEGEEFSLDLRPIVLELNGVKYFASSFTGPFGSYGGWGRDCDESRTLTPKSVKTYFEKPLPITEWSCFSLKFDSSAPSPEQQFVLYIDGLFREGKPFYVPPIHFQKNIGWRMHRDL